MVLRWLFDILGIEVYGYKVIRDYQSTYPDSRGS